MHFRRERTYYVYIMTNRSKTLYTGVTNDLERRVFEHKSHVCEGFTKRYQIDRLVYFEAFSNIRVAIARAKQIKGLLRVKKMALIVSMNPRVERPCRRCGQKHRSFAALRMTTAMHYRCAVVKRTRASSLTRASPESME